MTRTLKLASTIAVIAAVAFVATGGAAEFILLEEVTASDIVETFEISNRFEEITADNLAYLVPFLSGGDIEGIALYVTENGPISSASTLENLEEASISSGDLTVISTFFALTAE